jgi:hypothetical protein
MYIAEHDIDIYKKCLFDTCNNAMCSVDRKAKCEEISKVKCRKCGCNLNEDKECEHCGNFVKPNKSQKQQEQPNEKICFFDKASKREMCVTFIGEELWLCYKHIEGQYVTERKATISDIKSLLNIYENNDLKYFIDISHTIDTK